MAQDATGVKLTVASTIDESLHDVGTAFVLPRGDQRYHVRMPDSLGDPRLALETAPERLVTCQVALHELERDSSAIASCRLVDLSHATLAQ